MPQNECDIPFCGKNWGTFGKEIASWSLDDYRRSILENRIITLDVRGEARAEPLKRNDLRQKQVGLRSLVAQYMARKAWYSPYLVILQPWWVTEDMASNARHDPISDEHHLVTPSNWILTLIATALSSVEAINFRHPTCDPGADQMTSMRNAGPVEIVRNNKFLVGNAAQERSLNRSVSP